MKLLHKFALIFLCCMTIFCLRAIKQVQLDDQLFDAAWVGDLPEVQLALAKGADIHAYNDGALRSAAYKGRLSIVQFLLELPIDQRADIHAGDDCPLRRALYRRHWDIIACLLQHGADSTKLSPAHIELMCNSIQAQEYIARELHKALHNIDFAAVDLLVGIIPMEKLPQVLQEEIWNF